MNLTRFLSNLKVILTVLIFGTTLNFFGQFTISGSNGCNGNYTSLTNASGVFATLNAGGSQSGYNVVVTVTASSVAEAGTNSLSEKSWTSLIMYPTGTGYTISGSFDGALINFNSASNITFDGRVNASGSTTDLIISNTSSGTAASTIKFTTASSSNTIKYCTVKTSSTYATAGAIFLTSTSGTGNDNNTISNCSLTNAGARPLALIYSTASTSVNDSLVISNCKLYDNLKIDATSYAIRINANTTCRISDNSFYETTTLTPTISTVYASILSSLTSNGCVIKNNYIGGSSANCSGTWTINSSGGNLDFYGVKINTGNCDIDNNTIKGFSTSTTTGYNYFYGIEILNAAITSNIGVNSGNTIGATSGTGSISLSTTYVGSSYFYGIRSRSTNTEIIQNNNIGSITTTGTATSGYHIYGIYMNGTGTKTVSSNIIGSTITSNSINASALGDASGGSMDQKVEGITSISTSTITINNNTIANLINAHNGFGTQGGVIGINTSSGTNTITNNTIYNLSTASQCNDRLGSSYLAICGIWQKSTGAFTQTITGNTIYNLTKTNTTSNTSYAFGIHMNGNTANTHTVNNNFIHTITDASTGSSPVIYGIFQYSGKTNYSNNIVYLGASVSTSVPSLVGMADYAGANTTTWYFNSVYIGGSPTSGSATSSAFHIQTTNTKNIRNNVFVNARSNGGTASGKHYAIYVSSNTGLTLDYNDYFVSGTGGVLGYAGAADRADIAALRTGTSQDANSVSTNPAFASAGSTTAASYLPGTLTTGVAGTGITLDYAGTTRTAPNMGAYESAPVKNYYWVGGAGDWSSYATHWATTSGGSTFNTSVPTSADNVYFDAASGAVTVTVDATANAKNITCTGFTGTLSGSSALNCYGSLLLVSGMTNSYTGTLTMAATSGTNTITSGTKTISNLTINGTGGTFTAIDNTTVSGTFTMTTGTFNVGNAASALTMQTATFSQTGGTFNIAGSSTTANQILTVTGNFTLATGGTFDVNALAAANYSGRLNVAGNFTHSGTTLQATRSSLTYCLVYLNGTSGTQTLESTGQTGTIAWSVGASNAQCNIASTKSFTLAAAASFVVGAGTSTPDLLIDGTFVNSSAVGFTMTGTGTVSSTGTYQHAVNGGVIPTLTWSTGSLCYVTGMVATAPTGHTQNFYNLTWNCAAQTGTVNFNASPTIGNDFIITTTNLGSLVVSSTGTTSRTFTVTNDMTIAAGNFTVNTSTSGTGTSTLTVLGDLNINGGTIRGAGVSTDGTSNLVVINVSGTLTIANGATLNMCGSATGIRAVLNIKGDFTNSGTGAFTTSNYTTINFAGSGATQIINNASSGYVKTNFDLWNVNSGAVVQLASNILTAASGSHDDIFTVDGTLIFGTGSTDGTNSFNVGISTSSSDGGYDFFVVNTGGVLKITSPNGIANSATLGNIVANAGNSAKYSLGAGGIYHYVGTAAQVTGVGLPATISGGLVINNTSGGVTLSQTTTISGSGTCTLTSGILTTASGTILSVTNTSNGAVIGGSTTSYVNGPMRWTLANSSGGSYSFPVGKASITYSPFGLSSVTGTTPVVTVEAFSGDNGGSADAATISSLSTTEYWVVSNTGTYTTGSVSLGRTAIGSATQVGRGTSGGVYYGLNGTVSGNSVINSDLTGSTLGYFRLGGDASGYYWNGASIATNPAAGGTGTWGTANSWRQPTASGAQATWANANNAFLAGTAGTITLGSSPSPTATYIRTTGYTLATTGAARTLAGPINLSSYNLTLAPTSTSSADLTLSGIISGSGLLTHNGTGKTTLSGANTNSGGVTLTAGTLYLNNATSLGTGTFTVASGTTIDGGAITISPAVAQTWNGGFTFTGTNSLNLGTGAVALGSHTTITASHATNTLTIGGIISGAFNFSTAGTAGPIVLTGTNTYGGSTNIGVGSKIRLGSGTNIPNTSALTANGTLDMYGFSETIGSLAGSGTIDNTSGVGTYTLTSGGDASSTTFSGVIQNTSGTIALTKTGAGTLTLSGANSFKGAVIISTGGISANTLANSSSNSSLGTGATTPAISMAASTSLYYTGSGHSSNRAITLTGTGVTLDASGAGTMDLSGGVTGNTFGLVLTGSGNGAQSGVIGTTTGTITKTGTGTWTLSNTANTYTGATTVNAGILSFSTVANGGSNSGIGAATTTATNLVLGGGTLQYTGVTASTNKAFALTAATTSTIDVTTNTLTISGASGNSTTGALTKAGAGTLALTGANTFSGAVTINAGTLSVNTIANAASNSSLGTGSTTAAITIAGGATLAYTGSGHSSSRAIVLSSSGGIIDASGAGTMTLSGGVTGNTFGLVLTGSGNGVQSGIIGTTTGTVTKTGAGTWTLSNAANTYTGVTTVNAGTLSFSTVANGGSNSGIGAATNTATNIVLGGGTLQYTGATASTDRAFALTAATTSTIDVTTNTLTISGASGNSTNGALTKAGAGILILSGANTWTGNTTVSAGTLTLGAANRIADASNMVLSGGTFSTGATTGNSETVGTLTMSASSTINLGTGSHSLNFSASTNSTWTGTLTINGWTGSWDGTTGTAGKIYFGSSAAGLDNTSPTVAQIRFYNASTTTYYPAMILPTGELVPGPNTFYSKSSATPSTASNWNTSRAGTGTDAIAGDFTAGNIFVVQGTGNGGTTPHTMTTSAAWSVSGTNSKIQVENGATLIAANTFAITVAAATTFQVDNGGTYKHQNTSAYATTIFQGTTTLATTSTVEYNRSAVTLPTLTSYGNMIVNYTTNPGAVDYSTAITTCNGLTITAAPTSFALSGANSYSGTTTLTSGKLLFNNASSIGTGTFAINGGTIDNTTGSPITNTNNNVQTWGGNFTYTGSNILDLGTGTVTLGATRQVTVSASNLTVGGVISGATFGITKAGAGTLTLSGNNTYTGAVTISGGTLSINTLANASSNSSLGTGATTPAISMAAATTLSYTGSGHSTDRSITLTGTGATLDASGSGSMGFSGGVTGNTFGLILSGTGNGSQSGVIATTSGTLTKSGAGTWTLSGSNTYSGAVTINAGTLSVNTIANAASNSALGTGSTTAAITIAGGATLAYTGSGHSSSRAITLSGTGAIIDASGAGTMTLSGGVTGNTFGLVLTGSGNGSHSGVIGTTSGTLTKSGSGTWTLSGNNTFSGAVIINAGTLSVNTIANSASNSALGTGSTTAAITIAGGATLAYTGSGHSSSRAIALSSTGGIIDASGAGTMTLSGGVTGNTFGLVLTGSGNGVQSGVIGTTTGTVTKTGAGTWTLTGNNTYTGTTTISAGTLAIGAADRISNSSNLDLNGGTFSTGATTGYSETVGTLSMTASSTINLGSGVHSLNFSASTNSGWTGTLTIVGWTGSWNGTTGTAGKIYFGSSTAGLDNTTPTVSQIRFYDGVSYFRAIILSTGELVPMTDYIHSTSVNQSATVSATTTNPAKYYDDGGSASNHSSNITNTTYTFTPSVGGQYVRAVINTLNFGNTGDILKIYNGATTAARQIGSVTSSNNGQQFMWVSTSSEGSLTFEFLSDGATVGTGWDLDIYTTSMQGQEWLGGTSTATNTASNWEKSLLPVAQTSIYIPDVANDPNMGASLTVFDFRLETGATYARTAGSLTTYGDFYLYGSFNITAAYTILNGGSSGNYAEVGGTGSYANVVLLIGFYQSAYYKLMNSISTGYHLEMSSNYSNEFDMNDYDLTINGTSSGRLTIPASQVFYQKSGTLNIASSAASIIDASFEEGTGTTNFYRTGGNQTVPAITYYNLTISGGSSRIKTLTGNTSVSNNVSVSASTFLASGGFTLNVTGNLTNAGTCTIDAGIFNVTGGYSGAGTSTLSTGTLNVDGTFDATGGAITFSGAGNLNLGGATITSLGTFTCSTSTVNYDRIGSQTVLSAPTYYNLTASGGGSNIKTLAGTTSVTGALIIATSTSLDVNSRTINVTGAATIPGTATISTGTMNVDGTFDATGGGVTFSSNGNLLLGGATITDLGTFTPSTSTVTFDGTLNQTLNGTAPTFYNLTNSNTATTVTLNQGITVTNTLAMSGTADIDMNGNNIDLSSAGTITGETDADRIYDTAGTTDVSGVITTTRTLNAPAADNVGGMGALITSAANLGSTTIKRGHIAQTGNLNTSIQRYYSITPTTNTGLSATLEFNYFDSELNGQTANEASFVLFRSTDGGVNWTNRGGTVNTAANNVTLTGIDAFSLWTPSSEVVSPLPISLISFNAIPLEDKIELKWVTASEVNSASFEIEKSINGYDFSSISSTKAAGNSNGILKYTDYDRNPIEGISYYRLKLIDLDGNYKYSKIVSVVYGAKSKIKLIPNPSNGLVVTLMLKDLNNNSDSDAKIEVYNSAGELVYIETVNMTNISFTISPVKRLAPGYYTVKLSQENKMIANEKMIVQW